MSTMPRAADLRLIVGYNGSPPASRAPKATCRPGLSTTANATPSRPTSPIVFAALAVNQWIEHATGWSIRRFVKTARRYRTIEIQAGDHVITAADPLPDDLRQASTPSTTRRCALNEPTRVIPAGPSIICSCRRTSPRIRQKPASVAGNPVLRTPANRSEEISQSGGTAHHYQELAWAGHQAAVSVTAVRDPSVEEAVSSSSAELAEPVLQILTVHRRGDLHVGVQLLEERLAEGNDVG